MEKREREIDGGRGKEGGDSRSRRVVERVRKSESKIYKKGNHLTNEVVCNICEKVDDG